MAKQTQRTLRNLKTKLNANTFVRPGFDFMGWNTDKNAINVQYQDGDYVEAGFPRDTTLYAIWRQYSTVVGAFGLSTGINGYDSSTMGATQYVGDATETNFNWRDSEDASILPVSSVCWSGPEGKFIRTVYTTGTSARPQYSTDGINWIDGNTKMQKMVFCCGGLYENSPRYIVVCDPVYPGETAGDYVGPWYSTDGINWTRSKLNTAGTDVYMTTDVFEDCCYGRITVSNEMKDVFLVMHTCGGGKLDFSIDGGQTFTNALNRLSATNFDYNSCTIINNQIVCAGASIDSMHYHTVCFCIGTLGSDGISWVYDQYPTDTNGNSIPIEWDYHYRVRIVEGNGVYVLVAQDYIYTKTANGNLLSGWRQVKKLPTVTFDKETQYSSQQPTVTVQTSGAHLIFTGSMFVLALRSVINSSSQAANVHQYRDANNPTLYSTDGINWVQSTILVPTCRRLAVSNFYT